MGKTVQQLDVTIFHTIRSCVPFLRVRCCFFLYGLSLVVVFACAGQLLNLMCAFTALPILRMCITWLRARGASRFLPLDNNIYYHKLTGWFVLAYSIIHTMAHLLNFGKLKPLARRGRIK